jgi:hypothetical protein
MLVNSYNIEFGYELLSAVPYAYGLHLEGNLTGTISGAGSEPLYYFSPNHKINNEPRSWFNIDNARKGGLPYTFIHKYERPKLTFPPYKEVYKNNKYKWKKPTLVIANRYNKEWGVAPINFFDLPTLHWLFTELKKTFEIVYIATDLPKDLQDNEVSLVLRDRLLAKLHGVKVFQDIKRTCWNTSLLQVFANCEHYITMNGGYSILASFFTGTNIAYTRARAGVSSKEYKLKEFDRWYPNHNNQRTIGVYNEKQFKEKVKAIYIEKLPTANIILRTSNRPNAFRRAYNSIICQDYPNINLIVCTDDKASVEYTRGTAARHIDCSDINCESVEIEGNDYGKPFKSNLYINRAQQAVKEGFILILDDDDMFTCSNSVSSIMKHAKKDALVVSKVNINGQIIPNGSFGKEVKLYDITAIGLCYHVSHIDKTDWSEWKRADYRTAKKLSEHLPIIWLDAVLSKTQSKAGMGRRVDIINLNEGWMKTVRILNEAIGEVGKIKRLPKQIAHEQVKKGNAEYLKEQNEPMKEATVGKPIVTENKAINLVKENKDASDKPKGKTTRKPRTSKKAATSRKR